MNVLCSCALTNILISLFSSLNRIIVRDRQKDTELASQRLSLEDEYNRLDEECRTVTDEITSLENQLVR